MNAARRSAKRRDWPRGLDEPRPGYYSWRHPDGYSMAIGYVPFAVARNQALAANAHIQSQRGGLVERMTDAGHTMADLLPEMPAAENVNTAKSWRSLDKTIAAKLGGKACETLTVADCAELVEGLIKDKKARLAQAVRSRLVAVCKRGMQLGWMDSNPAEVTGEPDVKVKRGRLTLEMFRATLAKAPEVAEWLPQAMMLALLTGCDRSTIAGLQRAEVAAGYLTITRPKTKARVAIPLALRLDAVGASLAEVVAHRTGVLSKLLLHHVNPWGNAPAGSKVHPDRISHAFTEARKLAGIPDVMADGKMAPTFHEIRSLAKRLYDEQGNVDTKALLGHKTERMSDMYADPRGSAPIVVKVR